MPVPTAPTTPTPDATSGAAPDAIPPRRRLRRVVILALLLGGVVWFLPELVARTSLRQEVPGYLFPMFRGRVQLGETSLNWWAPIVVKDIQVSSGSGAPLFQLAELRSTSSLWEIVSHPVRLGRFDLQGLTAQVQLTGKGSNFDQTIEDFTTGEATGERAQVELVCKDARVEVSSGAEPTTKLLPEFGFRVRNHHPSPTASTLEVVVHNAQGGEGSLKIRGTLATDPTLNSLDIELQAEHWNLSNLTPFLANAAGAGHLGGDVNGFATISRAAADSQSWTCQSDLTIEQLELVGWPSLQGDELRVTQLRLQGEVALADLAIQCRDLLLTSEIAELKANGVWHLPQLLASATAQPQPAVTLVSTSAVKDDFALSGWIDGAALARQLPRTLHLQQKAELQQGRLTWSLASHADAEGRVWQGELALPELSARIDQSDWRWDQPVKGQFVVRERAGQLLAEEVALQTDFGKLAGKGTLQQAELTAEFDLDRLHAQLAPLVAWETFKIAGDATLAANLQTLETGTAQVEVRTRIESLVLGETANPIWSEALLEGQFNATAKQTGAGVWETVDTAQLQLLGGDDRFVIELLRPLKLQLPDRLVSLKLDLVGDLGRWQQRAAVWGLGELPTVAGRGRIVTSVDWQQNTLKLKELRGVARPLQVQTAGWNIDEPDVQVQTSGSWDAAQKVWTVPALSLVASCGRLDWKDGQIAPGSAAPVSGELRWNADLGRISAWQVGPVSTHLLGMMRGVAVCEPRDGELAFSVNTDTQNFALAGLQNSSNGGTGWEPWWKEPQMTLQAQGRYKAGSQAVELRNLQLAAAGISLAGSLSARSTPQQLEFNTQGNLTYDWAQLSQRMDAATAEKYQLTGADSKPFRLQGSWSRNTGVGAVGQSSVAGNLQIGWESARVLGIPVGSAEVVAEFTGDRGLIRPIDLAVAEGHLHLEPTFQFQPGPAVVSLAPGKIVDHIRLTPQVCRDSLKYVAPMLADSSEMEGAFSLDLSEAMWPLENTAAGRATGALAIHGAQVRPGPLSGRLVSLVEQVRAVIQRRAATTQTDPRVVIDVPEQVVNFRQEAGRVAHDRFVMRVRDVEIQTSGSVGQDDSLDLTAGIVIKDEWISDAKLKTALSGQVLRIPIRGTIQQPQMDTGGLGELARRAAGNVFEQAVEDKVRQQLDRLLPRK